MTTLPLLLLSSRPDVRSDWSARSAAAGVALDVAELPPSDLNGYEAILVDLSDSDPATLIAELRQRDERMPVVALGDAFEERALEAGADAWVPLGVSHVALGALASRLGLRYRGPALRLPAQRSEASPLPIPALLGTHPAMLQLQDKAAQVARTRATVLIHGESGVGKELLAAGIHAGSPRKDGPFVRLNCAALSDSVLESELFGHEKGAFTGALSRRLGRFELADGGTLFLDEVSEIPRPVQVKLLRFLQEREFERVGGNESIRVDVRVLAASNRDLKLLVKEGEFREDLFYRLNVVGLTIPPLRARPSDILPLSHHFAHLASQDHEVEFAGIDSSAERVLLQYPWPGNVRELRNAIEQALIFASGGLITDESLPLTADPSEHLALITPGMTLDEIQRFVIQQTLRSAGGSTARAAATLGMSRRTLQHKLKQWGADVAEMDSGREPESSK